MTPSRRVRVFGTGFLAGCVLAAAIAWFRAADEPPPPEPLPSWSTISPPPPLPSAAGEAMEMRPIKAWESAGGARRWLAEDADGDLWRIGADGDGAAIVRADRIRAFGSPGIEFPALRAGLVHNGFEPLSFDPLEILFVVPVNAFEPDAIERAQRLLESRKPYIRKVEAISLSSSN